MTVLGLIGGSGLLKSKLGIFSSLTAQHVPTSAGTVVFHVGTIPGSAATLVFCQRHAASPTASYSQPSDINYAAIMLGMLHYRVDCVVAICSVGTLHPDRIPCGTLAVPNDFYCPYDLRPVYSDARGHFVPGIVLFPPQRCVGVLLRASVDCRVVHPQRLMRSFGRRFWTCCSASVFVLW
jgi:purine nucleoside phosphorylase